MKTNSKTTILIATLILILSLCVMVATIGFMSTAKAEVASGEVSGEVMQPEEESKGNWFSENWQSVVEIITSSGALAVIFAIIRLFSKIAKLRVDLGNTGVDNKAIKEGFNAMVDEVEALKHDLAEIHKSSEVLKSEVATSAEKSVAVLAIFEKLISASDLPSEIKQSMQAVINKATIEEEKSDDEA